MTEAMSRMGVSAAALRHHLTADMMHDALRADVQSAMIAAGAANPEKNKEVLEGLSGHAALFREQLMKIEASCWRERSAGDPEDPSPPGGLYQQR